MARGIEMMLTSMLGISPEEMQRQAKEAIDVMRAAASDMQEIKERLTAIEMKLDGKALVNGRRNKSDSGTTGITL